MTKTLEDMSLKELWQLFPIVLREHQVEWKDWYEEERFRLLSFLPEHQIVRLSHNWLNIGRDHLGQAHSGYHAGDS